MADPDENASIVNAIQRHASVVVQKFPGICRGSARRSSRSCAIAMRQPSWPENAHRRVVDEFLGDRHLEQYALLFEQLGQGRS